MSNFAHSTRHHIYSVGGHPLDKSHNSLVMVKIIFNGCFTIILSCCMISGCMGAAKNAKNVAWNKILAAKDQITDIVIFHV